MTCVLEQARRAMRAVAVATSLALLVSAPARADDETDAEALFDQGHKLLADPAPASLAQACALFTQSFKLAQRGDTLLNLAECHRRQGKIATAWAEFDQAIPMGEQVRFTRAIQIAKQLRDDLATKLSTLTVTVPPELAALEGFAVEVNGEGWPKQKWNRPAILDPGPIEVKAVAKGFKTFLGHIDLAEKETKTVGVALEHEPPPPKPVVPPPPPPPKPKPVVKPPPVVAQRKPVWPWIVGGAGVVLGGAAIGFAIDQRSASKGLNDNCGADRKACPPGYDFNSARSRELRDYGLFVGLGAAGIVGIGAGVVGLGVFSRPTAHTSLQIGPGSIGLQGDF